MTIPPPSSRRALVTGANGFVGKAVCRRLLATGWSVFGAVRRDVALPPGVVAVRVDELGGAASWSEALAGMDAVVHLAARVHVMRDSARDPLAEFRRVNTQASLRLAQEAAAAGVGRFVFVSSIKVNGEGRDAPYTLADGPAPQDPYGRSKAEAEAGLATMASAGFKVAVLRPPLVYGPGVGGNFRKLLAAVHRGWPLPLGAVTNRRSLVHVDNLADAVGVCLEAEGGAPFETWLLADEEAVSTAELIRRLGRLMDRPARLPAVPVALLRLAGRLLGKAAAVDRLTGSLVVDAQAFRDRFGWRPPFSLQEGLAQTAAWFAKDGTNAE